MKMQALVSLSCSCVLLAAGVAAFGQAAGEASAADKHFVHRALMGGMAEVQLGQIASPKASDQEVKQLGQKMMDHTKTGEQMKGVASQTGVSAPAALSPEDQARFAARIRL